MPLPRSRNQILTVTVLGALTVLLIAMTARGSLAEVLDLFRLGRYDEASQALATEDPDDPAGHIWQQRLSNDPDQAFELGLEQVRNRDLPHDQRVQAALDAASVALARNQPEAVWQVLQPLLDLDQEALPGEVFLLAGQTLRLAGDRQRAREMLASVRPDDPAFAAARSLLGRIGLESGDFELALRYFESAEKHAEGAVRPELMAGSWQALRYLGRDLEAREMAEMLLREHPNSLASMEVTEHLRREDEELAALADTLDQAAPELLPETHAGRFVVQLAAYRDRSLALQFVSRWQPEIPDLEIVRELDDLGQPLYKVQMGQFVSRAQARAELTRLEQSHALEGFVVGSND